MVAPDRLPTINEPNRVSPKQVDGPRRGAATAGTGVPEFRITGAMLPFTPSDPTRIQKAGCETWLADLRRLGDLGFDAVDITDSWLRPGDLSSSRLGELGSVLRTAGLEALAISAIRRSVIDPAEGDANLAYSHRTIEAASALGCPIVSVGLHRPLLPRQRAALWFWTVDGPRDLQDRETYRQAATRLRELGQHGEEVGVELSLELYEGTLLGTAESAVRLLEQIGHPNVGLNPDIGNLVRQHGVIEPIDIMLDLTLPYANYWHLKNYLRLEDSTTGQVLTTPATMEHGVINYRSAIKEAVGLGFRGPFCVEHYGGDMLGIMKTNLEYTRTVIEEAVFSRTSVDIS